MNDEEGEDGEELVHKDVDMSKEVGIFLNHIKNNDIASVKDFLERNADPL